MLRRQKDILRKVLSLLISVVIAGSVPVLAWAEVAEGALKNGAMDDAYSMDELVEVTQGDEGDGKTDTSGDNQSGGVQDDDGQYQNIDQEILESLDVVAGDTSGDATDSSVDNQIEETGIQEEEFPNVIVESTRDEVILTAQSISTSAIEGVCNRYGFYTGWYWTSSYCTGSDDTGTYCDTDFSASPEHRAHEYRYRGYYQCQGFARFLAKEVTGSEWDSGDWASKTLSSSDVLQPGDLIIHSSHSAMVYSVSGDQATFAECWGDSNNKLSVGSAGFNYYFYTAGSIVSAYPGAMLYRFNGNVPAQDPTRQPTNRVITNFREGCYSLRLKRDPNQCVTISNAGTGDGVSAVVWSWSSGKHQYFNIRSANFNGSYNIQPVHTYKYLEVWGGSQVNQGNVVQNGANGQNRQRWYIEKNDDGTFSFMNVSSGLYLDYDYGMTANGTNIQQYEYNGSQTMRFYLVPGDAAWWVSDPVASVEYTGSALKPTVNISSDNYTGKLKLVSGIDYTLEYSNNTNAGTATWTATSIVKPSSSITGTFTITPASIAKAIVSTIADQTYTGKAIKPVPRLSFGGKTLAIGTDYDISYSNNTSLGTATVIITGKGNYTGVRKVTFSIVSPFADVTTSTAHADDISWLAAQGISAGWDMADGSKQFRPYANVARADMAAFLYRLAGSPSYTPSAATKRMFSDVTSSTPHAKEIWWLASKGISTGFPDGTFRPYANVARADMAAFLHRMGALG